MWVLYVKVPNLYHQLIDNQLIKLHYHCEKNNRISSWKPKTPSSRHLLMFMMETCSYFILHTHPTPRGFWPLLSFKHTLSQGISHFLSQNLKMVSKISLTGTFQSSVILSSYGGGAQNVLPPACNPGRDTGATPADEVWHCTQAGEEGLRCSQPSSSEGAPHNHGVNSAKSSFSLSVTTVFPLTPPPQDIKPL